MATYRQVYTSYWQDSFVLTLTPEEKYFYLYLITNEKTSICGIYELSIKIAEVETGYNRETIEKLLKKFEKDYQRVYYSTSTNEICIVNWLKYNVNKSPKVIIAIEESLKKVKNKELIGYLYGIDTLSFATVYVTVPDTDKEFLNKDKDISNVNDNDNERIVPRIVNKDEIFKKFANGDEELFKALKDFEKMRKAKSKPLTDRAKELLIKGLVELEESGENIIDCINQSILNSWLGVFPVKRGDHSATNKKPDGKDRNKSEWGITTTRL